MTARPRVSNGAGPCALDAAAGRDADAARRLVAALHPGARRGVSRWANGWPQLTLAVRWTGGRARWEIQAPRQLTRGVEAAVAAAYPGAELEALDATAAMLPAACGLASGASHPMTGLSPSADFGAILVELMSRLPAEATARRG